MNNLVEGREFKQATISSREVAEMLGKSHGDLLKEINGRASGDGVGIIPTLNRMIEDKSNLHLSNYFIESEYKAGTRTYKEYLITKKGIGSILALKPYMKGIESLADYYDNYFKENVPLYVVEQPPRVEIQFGEQLILFINQLGYSVKTQYKVLNYRVDFYIPELNVAIEYDEQHHAYQLEGDKQRELDIQNEIGCKFIRIEDELNIGSQLGQIINHIKEEI